MASGKVIVPSNAITKKKEKANKKLTWTDQDTDVFAEVIYDPQYRGSDYTVGWATVGNLSNGRFRGDGDLDRKLNHDPCVTAHDLANFPAVAGTSAT